MRPPELHDEGRDGDISTSPGLGARNLLVVVHKSLDPGWTDAQVSARVVVQI